MQLIPVIAQAALDQAIGNRAQSRGGRAQGQTTQPEAEDERLAQLASFQRAAVLHAMKFPRVRRVVYSTCSIHQAENEDVVAAILADQPPAAASDNHPAPRPFAVVNAFGGDGQWSAKWKRRGDPNCGFEFRDRVVRCKPGTRQPHACFDQPTAETH